MKKTTLSRIVTPIRPLLLVAIGLVVIALVTVQTVWATASAGQAKTIDGVLHIQNGAEPTEGKETLKLKELWRVGGADDDEVIFGIVIQALSDPQKNLYLLDTQLSTVQVFSEDGEFLRNISREGDGPAEVRSPVDMTMLPDGSLGILQAFPGKITKVSLSGEPMGQFTVGDPADGGFMMLIDAQARGGNILLGGTRMVLTEGLQTLTNFLASFDEEANELVRFEESTIELNLANLHIVEDDQYFPHMRHWAISPDNLVYVASYRNEYKINVYNMDGQLNRVISREYKVPARSAQQKNEMKSFIEAQSANSPISIQMDFSDTEPVISSLFIDDNGYLWVANSASGIDEAVGIMRTYDKFDLEGNFIKQIAIECEGESAKDGLIFTSDNRIVLITGFAAAAQGMLRGAGVTAPPTSEDDDEPMMIICYEY